MDALIHNIEAYISVNATMHTDSLAYEGIKLISQSIRTAVFDGSNMWARDSMAMGSMMGGIAFGNAGVGAVHALSYPIGGMFHVPHGVANTMVLPWAMEYNMLACLRWFRQFGEAMGENMMGLSDREAAVKTVAALRQLADDLDVPQYLSDVDIPESAIPDLVEGAKTQVRLWNNNPRKFTPEDMEQVYRNMAVRPGSPAGQGAEGRGAGRAATRTAAKGGGGDRKTSPRPPFGVTAPARDGGRPSGGTAPPPPRSGRLAVSAALRRPSPSASMSGVVHVEVRDEAHRPRAFVEAEHARARRAARRARRPACPCRACRRRPCWSAPSRGRRPARARRRGARRARARGGGRRPGAPRCARSAYRPAAAMMPAWRMPPPKSLRARCARRDGRGVPDEHRADRRAQALGQADAHRVERARRTRPRETPMAATALNRRAPSRCMREVVPVAEARAPRACARVGSTTPPQWLCVFSRQTRRVGAQCDVGVGVDVLLHLLEVERAVRGVEHAQLHVAERRGGALLVEDDVRLGVQEDLVAAPREGAHRRLVAHRPGREVEAGLLAEQPGGVLLQAR